MNLTDIFAPVEQELIQVKKLLNIQVGEILDRHIPGSNQIQFFNDLLNRILSNPGKMLRPVLTLLSAKAICPEMNKDVEDTVIRIAAAVELIHAASLVHDDIIDDAEERRGKPSLNKVFNNKIAVLAGDILYAQFFSIITKLPVKDDSLKLRILNIFCEVSQQMCLGEINQHRILKSNDESGKDEYLDILKNKTAVLMSACCRSGAIAAGATVEMEQTMSDFGLKFGLAFQLADDLKDGDAVYENNKDIKKLGIEQSEQAKEIAASLENEQIRSSFLSLCNFLRF
ncbi:MAG: polyprenyl synthetase family protein [Spirochaetaceae bacterium]|jgi:geranylgeranyl pyrophosphate synthase|nr:polyprenyl synthetase family protein [Spirochaetaceae bacterium]